MIKIKEAFENKKAFIAYLMAGDPDLETSGKHILELQQAGVDLIEIGIPFSDPIAEGEVIQRASERALHAGARLDRIFVLVKSLKGRMQIPLVFMTYLNPVFVYGYDRFFAETAEAGVSGIIIPDLPFEEQEEVRTVANSYGVEVIPLIAPSSGERIAQIAQNAQGFVYLVSSLGVTGVRKEITTDIYSMVGKIKAVTDVPVAVGFGIATPQQVEQYSALADGVIMGSAIVKQIEETQGNMLTEHVRLLKQAQLQ